jgi:hypothetical protein
MHCSGGASLTLGAATPTHEHTSVDEHEPLGAGVPRVEGPREPRGPDSDRGEVEGDVLT